MFMLFLISSVIFLLSMILLVLMFLLKKKTFEDLEKLSPFECGFIPHNNSRSLFSIHFFLIAILFLIFDVELVLLFPLLASFSTSEVSWIVFMALLVLLLVGLLYEWSQKMLDWTNFP